ncbi:MAG: AzlD domain-containing protein [Clostridia bacterium]|nr:AzlD domain-containing protein [Clostridia bacterium]
MIRPEFFLYLLVMAGVTYLIRTIPLVLFKKKIKNVFVLSFLHYMPYAVLSVMTFPTMIYATGSIISGIVGLIVALVSAYFNRSLVTVALLTCISAYITQVVINLI